MDTTNAPAPGTILGNMPDYDLRPAVEGTDTQPNENPPHDDALALAKAKLSRLVECYAPIGVQSDAKSALASAIEEFEQAVRADEFSHVEASAKQKAQAMFDNEKYQSVRPGNGPIASSVTDEGTSAPPAPLNGELPPVSTADGTPLAVLPGAIPVVESENAPREIGDMPEAPKGEPILGTAPAAQPSAVEPSDTGDFQPDAAAPAETAKRGKKK